MAWLFSLFIVAFAQPAWIRGLGPLAAACGFALFWSSLIKIQSGKLRFFSAFGWFTVVQGIQLSWMATIDYMGPLIIAFYLFLILAMGVQFALLCYFVKGSMKWDQLLFLAGFWTLLEWIRLFFLCGFTWNPVGLALTDSIYSIQFASIWGIFGLSFWVILTNGCALNAWVKKSTKAIAIWGCIAFFPYIFGLCQQKWIESTHPIEKHLKVALVQTALLPQQKDYQARFAKDYIPPIVQWERILDVLRQQGPVDLIVLPEAALPMGAYVAHYPYEYVRDMFSKDALPKLGRPLAELRLGGWKVSNAFMMQALANQMNAHVVVGLDDTDATGRYNAAFHFTAKKSEMDRYEKRVLVPVGEYLPLVHWKGLSQFIGDQFGIYSSFDTGVEAKVFHATVPLGASICLEETFSQITRELRLKGAEMFVNLTNDVWFPNSKLPRQHFDHGRVRAAENGVPLLRSCNAGMTGAVDCFGNPFALLSPSEKETASLTFLMPIRSYSTLYTFWGDSSILFFSFLSMGIYFWKRRKSCRK